MTERTHLTLRIEGMTCDGCARHVTEALKGVMGGVEAHVPGWRSGHATVIAETAVADEALMSAVRDAGYRALVRERRPLGHPMRSIDRMGTPVEGERRAPKPEGADYDLMIIGGGSAAFAAAIKGAELGANVAIVEGGTIGGTCVNIGCVPSKTLIKAAELCYRSAYPKFEGLTACPPPSDWRRVIEQKDELVAALRQGKYINVMDVYPNITLIRGWARLAGGRQVSVNGTTYTPGKIIIAIGVRRSQAN